MCQQTQHYSYRKKEETRLVLLVLVYKGRERKREKRRSPHKTTSGIPNQMKWKSKLSTLPIWTSKKNKNCPKLTQIQNPHPS